MQKKEFKHLAKIEYIDKNAIEDNTYAFFIYLLEISSYTRSLTFVPVVVNIVTGKIDVKYSENLFDIIKKGQDAGNISILLESIKESEDKAREHLVYRERQIEADINKTNDSLINDRLSSLKQTYDISVSRVRDIINKLSPSESNKKIITMREAQLTNMKNNYERKKAEFEKAKTVIISHEFIGGGILFVRRDREE